MSILVLNAGSSSLKFALFDDRAEKEMDHGQVDWHKDADRTAAIAQGIGHHADVRIVGHRVVHGGTKFRQAIVIDENVSRELAKLSELAPLHNPPALDGIAAAQRAFPQARQIAMFDTAFYADLPDEAIVYPLPYEWFTDWGIRRFGFHGISHQYCTGRAAEILRSQDSRLVICHLGNGASATAVRAGKPVATTMGYTPMEGLAMGTRCGSVDPGILLHLLDRGFLSAPQLDDTLNHRSGLLGISGVDSDYRAVESAASAGNQRAKLAIDIFCRRVRGAIGELTATLGGIDALIFTAGIGEHSASARAKICEGLDCMGLILDKDKNAAAVPDVDTAMDQSTARILVIHTQEELLIARTARDLT